MNVIETHISRILLDGELALKQKKPVVLPFVDYGTRVRRAHCCAEEVRLNRRFAPELYLGVVALEDGEPAVKMRRFDENDRLDHVCARGELQPVQLVALAGRLQDFFTTAAAATPEKRFGAPEWVWSPVEENFVELAALLPEHGPRLAALRQWSAGEFARLQPVFAARKAAGRVREGHGDLHLANLVLLDGAIVPFDGIEFNDDLRWNDVASEIAFLWMDLIDHGRPDLAGGFLDAWLSASGDYEALTVLGFYAVYRALVRAKVAALSGRPASDYLALAETLATPPTPALLLTHGLSGSGKSTASAALLWRQRSGRLIRLRSDVERKRLFGLVPLARSDGSIYTPEATAATYGRLRTLAGEALAAGFSVIVDAAFLRRAERSDFRALAATRGLRCVILACEAPVDELRRRLRQRQNDASEATVEVLEQQLGWMEPLTDDERALVDEKWEEAEANRERNTARSDRARSTG